MDKPGSNHQEKNQPNITAAIASLQASVDKLQSILTRPQEQADIQAKMETSAEQAMARLQARLSAGQMGMFSPFHQNSEMPVLTNPYNTPAMQKQVMEVLESSLNNPHRAKMEAFALQTVVDIANNPHWESASKEVANFLESARNPYLASMQSDLATFSAQAGSEATYEEQKINIKESDAVQELRRVEAQLEADSAVNKNSLFEVQEAKYLKTQNELRLEDIVTGEANKIREDRIRRKQHHGIDYNDSVSPTRKGLIPEYQCLTADEELILTKADSSPEKQLIENLGASLFSLPPALEMANHALQGITNNTVGRIKQKKNRIEAYNDQIDRLRAKARQTERLAEYQRYKEYWNKMPTGHDQTPEYWQEIGKLGERADAGLGVIRESEICGRAERLKQKLKRTMAQGGDPNLLAPPVLGSEAKFEDTRSLDQWQQLANAGIGPAVEIASSIVYGKLGQMGAQVVKYTEDKTNQIASQKREICSKVNSTVALDRSRDIQDRLYYHETAEQTAAWLSEEMSKMNKEETNGCTNPATVSLPARNAITSPILQIDRESHGQP